VKSNKEVEQREQRQTKRSRK